MMGGIFVNGNVGLRRRQQSVSVASSSDVRNKLESMNSKHGSRQPLHSWWDGSAKSMTLRLFRGSGWVVDEEGAAVGPWF